MTIRNKLNRIYSQKWASRLQCLDVFSPANVVPGISFSTCKMLQARIFAYADAHRYRLGTNYELLPINHPQASETNNYQRDGFMRFDGNAGTAINYEPNSFGSPKADPAYKEPPLKISGDADHCDQQRGVDDDYIQPGNLFRLMPPDEQGSLINNIVGTLKDVPVEIQKKMVEHSTKAFRIIHLINIHFDLQP